MCLRTCVGRAWGEGGRVGVRVGGRCRHARGGTHTCASAGCGVCSRRAVLQTRPRAPPSRQVCSVKWAPAPAAAAAAAAGLRVWVGTVPPTSSVRPCAAVVRERRPRWLLVVRRMQARARPLPRAFQLVVASTRTVAVAARQLLRACLRAPVWCGHTPRLARVRWRRLAPVVMCWRPCAHGQCGGVRGECA